MPTEKYIDSWIYAEEQIWMNEQAYDDPTFVEYNTAMVDALLEWRYFWDYWEGWIEWGEDFLNSDVKNYFDTRVCNILFNYTIFKVKDLRWICLSRVWEIDGIWEGYFAQIKSFMLENLIPYYEESRTLSKTLKEPICTRVKILAFWENIAYDSLIPTKSEKYSYEINPEDLRGVKFPEILPSSVSKEQFKSLIKLLRENDVCYSIEKNEESIVESTKRVIKVADVKTHWDLNRARGVYHAIVWQRLEAKVQLGDYKKIDLPHYEKHELIRMIVGNDPDIEFAELLMYINSKSFRDDYNERYKMTLHERYVKEYIEC